MRICDFVFKQTNICKWGSIVILPKWKYLNIHQTQGNTVTLSWMDSIIQVFKGKGLKSPTGWHRSPEDYSSEWGLSAWSRKFHSACDVLNLFSN